MCSVFAFVCASVESTCAVKFRKISSVIKNITSSICIAFAESALLVLIVLFYRQKQTYINLIDAVRGLAVSHGHLSANQWIWKWKQRKNKNIGRIRVAVKCLIKRSMSVFIKCRWKFYWSQSTAWDVYLFNKCIAFDQFTQIECASQ